MLKRTKYFIGGFFIAVTVGAIAQTGGLPTRPRFLSVGVGTAAPSTNGNVNVSGSVTASNFVGNVGGVAPSDFARLSQSNTFNGNINATGTVTAANASISGTATVGTANIGTLTATSGILGEIEIAKGAAGRGYITASNGGPSNSGYFNFIDETDNRAGYIGFADATEFRITAEGGRALAIAAAGGVTVNGSEVCRQNGIGCSTDFAQLSQSNIFSSPNAQIVLSSTTLPQIAWIQQSGSQNNRRWDFISSVEAFRGRVVNDANNAATEWLTIERTGITVDSINLQATNVLANSERIWSGGVAYKSADTDRTNSTTITADPHLQISIPSAGTYAVDAFISVAAPTPTSQGIKYSWTFSGTLASTVGYQSAQTVNGTAALVAGSLLWGTTYANTELSSAGTDHYRITGTLIASSSGTLSYQWAQNASSANATRVRIGSWVRVTRLN